MKSPKKKSSVQPKSQEPKPEDSVHPATPRKIRSLFKIPNLSDLGGGDKKNKSKKNEVTSPMEAPALDDDVPAKEDNPATEDTATRRKKKDGNGEKAVKKRRKSVERKSEKPKRSASVEPKSSKPKRSASVEARAPRDSEQKVKSSKPKKQKSIESLRSPESVKQKKVGIKGKTKRRKSIGATTEAIDLVSPMPKTPKSNRSVTSLSTSLGSEGLDDLMANLDAADAEAASEDLTSPTTPSRKPKLRTTVDDRGKIRRVGRGGMVRRGSIGEDEDDDINSRGSNNSSLMAAHEADRRARRRSLGRSADGERAAPGARRSVERRPLGEDAGRRDAGKSRSLERRPPGDAEGMVSPRRTLDSRGRVVRSPRSGSDQPSRANSVRSYRSDGARDDDDSSVHSSRSENYLRNKRLGRKARLSLTDVTKDIELRKRRLGPSSDRSLKSDRSVRSARSQHSNVSIDSVIEKYAGAANDDSDVSRLERDLSKSEEKVRALIEEQRTGQAEAAKARTELMHFKLDFQKLEKKNRELQDEIKVVDDHVKEKDRKIANLEKAVESQLDKVDDLESDLKNANEEIYKLEDKIKELELRLGSLDESDDTKAAEMKKQLDEKREESIAKRHRELDEKAKKLAEEKEKLDELRKNQSLINDNRSSDDKKLLEELKMEQSKAAKRLKEKDAKIEELQGKVDDALHGGEKSSVGGDSLHDENEKLQEMLKSEQSKAASTIKKKDDTIAYMKMEMAKLKKALSERDVGSVGNLKKEMESLSSEADAVRSQFEGAQRRNMLLEEEIDHWKSLNCNLEDDLDSLKSEAAEWKAKYHMIAMNGDGGDSMHRPMSARNLGTAGSFDNPAVAKYIMRDPQPSDDRRLVNSERGARTVSNLWNAFANNK